MSDKKELTEPKRGDPELSEEFPRNKLGTIISTLADYLNSRSGHQEGRWHDEACCALSHLRVARDLTPERVEPGDEIFRVGIAGQEMSPLPESPPREGVKSVTIRIEGGLGGGGGSSKP